MDSERAMDQRPALLSATIDDKLVLLVQNKDRGYKLYLKGRKGGPNRVEQTNHFGLQ